MKNRLLLYFLIFGITGFSQGREAVDYEKISLNGLTYKSSYNVFAEEDRDKYILERFENLEGGFSWGNFISFTEKTFHTYYNAPCGNDCFTSVDGSYKFVGSLSIEK